MSNYRIGEAPLLFDPASGALVGAIDQSGTEVGIAAFPIWCESPYILAQSGVPVILSSSATAITATGAVSGATALPYVPSGVVQVFMALAGLGGASQLYYARYSSASAFQLYLDAAGTVTPTGLTAGAYAGTTAEVTLASVIVPGGSMGPNGSIQVDKQYSMASTATAKNLREYWGGALAEIFTAASQAGLMTTRAYQNRGAGAQIRTSSTAGGWGYIGPAINTADTTQDVALTFTAQLASTSDYAALEKYRCVIYPGA